MTDFQFCALLANVWAVALFGKRGALFGEYYALFCTTMFTALATINWILK